MVCHALDVFAYQFEALQNLKLMLARVHMYRLVPRSHQAFHHLQYGKAGRAWYLFSHEHESNRKFSERTSYVLHIVQLTTHLTLSVYDNRPPLARYMQ